MSIPQPSKLVTTVAVLAVLLTVSLLAARRPYYNWDMFPYMAIAMQDPSVPFDTTHRDVYRVAKATLPPADFEAISIRQPGLMKDASDFEGILKYYSIKPVYNLIVSGLYGLGIDPVASTWLPSVACYFLLGGLLLFWTSLTGPHFPAGLFTLVIMLSPLTINLARFSSPDMLCAATSVVGFLLILSGRPSLGLLCLLVTVWIRPDAAILMSVVALVLPLSGNSRWTIGILAFVTAVASIFILFKDQTLFNEYLLLDDPIDGRVTAFQNGIESLLKSYTLPAMIVAAALMYTRRRYKLRNLGKWLVIAAVASLLARYVLHPYVEDRFHLPAYLLILLVAWDTLVTRFYPTMQRTSENL